MSLTITDSQTISGGALTNVRITWSGYANWYDITLYRNGTLICTELGDPITATYYDDADMSHPASYSYIAYQSGSPSNTINITSYDLQAPSGCGVVKGSGVLTVSWTNNGDTPTNTYLEKKVDSGSWSVVSSWGYSREAYDDSDFTSGHTYYYRARVDITGYGYSNYSNEASIAVTSDPTTVEISVSDTTTLTEDKGTTISGVPTSQEDTFLIRLNYDGGGTGPWANMDIDESYGTDTQTDTFSFSTIPTSLAADSQSIDTDYALYYGDLTGNVYLTSATEFSDDGVPITAYWTSKVTDFGDLYQDCINAWKTVYRVKVKYVDLYANTVITVYLWSDKDTTWTSQSMTVGTGDNSTKDIYFYFLKTGQFFQWKIESASSDKTFLLMDTSVYFTLNGESFYIS